jgi:hypothetical protein
MMISFDLPCYNCELVSYVHESQYCDVCQNYLCENCIDHLTACQGCCYSLYCNNCGTEDICDNCYALTQMEIERYNEQNFEYNYTGTSRSDKYHDWNLYKENFIIDYMCTGPSSPEILDAPIESSKLDMSDMFNAIYNIQNSQVYSQIYNTTPLQLCHSEEIDIDFDKMDIKDCTFCSKDNLENRGICTWGTVHCTNCTEGWVCECGEYICVDCYSEFLNCACKKYNCPRHLNLLLEACPNCNARYCTDCFEQSCPKCAFKKVK